MQLSLGKHSQLASKMSLSSPNYFVNNNKVGRGYDVALDTLGVEFHIVVLIHNGCPSV